ncbi:phosphatase PAP2 family protein [Bacillus canaveralius]|uniref:Phosphatase PAP2 family protein n=2 Tax=Bacillus canaveralius TaxID=1403243 RepID=A0A2N5GQS5_9BACI|nr:phosphatase PAP2 family protein [Bacillus canaveralius]PLR85571.1 phosphatase PAP2 family protein [Bacillus canaveralius]PLR94768.1 phosphatase PAP2 family protein [Bacillus canaveralius]RSK54698.1 phosphatase PAP2 family protein [Bacillus canaveralius]
MMSLLRACYDFECRIFQEVNRYFDNKYLNLFFRTITQIGGAAFTIGTVLIMIIFSTSQTRITAIASALALLFSHIPVSIVKKLYPRKRPYLMLEKTKFPANPLEDHSFPSGHTTAIFSVIMPFVIHIPILAFALIPLGLCVGISRIYLGLHYPSDVISGMILGSSVAGFCYDLSGIYGGWTI